MVWSLLLPLLFLLGMGSVLFGAAGRRDLPFFWATVAVHGVALIVAVLAMDPELRRERLRPGSGGKDRFRRWILLPAILAHWIVAGLDAGRFHWSGGLPAGVQAAGVVGLLFFMGLSVAAMAVNRFFSPVVRIQHERRHRLITSGPYRLVRHPGYLGGVGGSICSAVSLGSLWSLVPVVLVIAGILRRAAIEDRYLHAQLDGYPAYAARVRYRVVPGVW